MDKLVKIWLELGELCDELDKVLEEMAEIFEDEKFWEIKLEEIEELDEIFIELEIEELRDWIEDWLKKLSLSWSPDGVGIFGGLGLFGSKSAKTEVEMFEISKKLKMEKSKNGKIFLKNNKWKSRIKFCKIEILGNLLDDFEIYFDIIINSKIEKCW